MAEITSPDFPGERLVVCKNPLLAEERARKRERIAGRHREGPGPHPGAACSGRRSRLRGAAEIGKAVGAVLGKRKMAKHFEIDITDAASASPARPRRSPTKPGWTASTCLRTSLPAEQADTAATVRSYKSLAQVERAFRCMKTVDLELRPVFHWTAPRVRAHVLLCMLAYYLEWHMRQKLAPMLFDDHDRAAAEAQRTSPVAKAKPSPAARRKAASKRTDPVGGSTLPVHSFRTLLDDLATLTRNVVCFGGQSLTVVTTTPTELQRQALDLLGADLAAV